MRCGRKPRQARTPARSSPALAEPVPESFPANRDAVLVLVDSWPLVSRGFGMGPPQSIVSLAIGAIAQAVVLQEPVIESPSLWIPILREAIDIGTGEPV